jgi:hypothetical protein
VEYLTKFISFIRRNNTAKIILTIVLVFLTLSVLSSIFSSSARSDGVFSKRKANTDEVAAGHTKHHYKEEAKFQLSDKVGHRRDLIQDEDDFKEEKLNEENSFYQERVYLTDDKNEAIQENRGSLVQAHKSPVDWDKPAPIEEEKADPFLYEWDKFDGPSIDDVIKKTKKSIIKETEVTGINTNDTTDSKSPFSAKNKASGERNIVYPIKDKEYTNVQLDAIINFLSDGERQSSGESYFAIETLSSSQGGQSKGAALAGASGKAVSLKGRDAFNIRLGATFKARLLTPLNTIYQQFSPLIEFTNGRLKGFRSAGSMIYSEGAKGVILHFAEMEDSYGQAYTINAYGINIQTLSPTFADEINRHLGPKIGFSVLSALTQDTMSYQNETSQNEYGVSTPYVGQTIANKTLSAGNKVIENILKTYQDEVKVNPQAMIIIFY